MSTIEQSKYEVALEKILRDEIADFTVRAIESAEKARAEFFRAVEERGAFDAMKWKADSLLSSEMEADLGKALSRWVEMEDKTVAEAMEHAKDYLQREANTGLTSSWSGLFSNECAKARGIAALNLLGHGSFAYLESGCRHRALYAVLPAEPRVALSDAESFLRDAKAKLDRARSEESIERLQQVVARAEDAVSIRREHLERAAREAGVPEDLIGSVR